MIVCTFAMYSVVIVSSSVEEINLCSLHKRELPAIDITTTLKCALRWNGDYNCLPRYCLHTLFLSVSGKSPMSRWPSCLPLCFVLALGWIQPLIGEQFVWRVSESIEMQMQMQISVKLRSCHTFLNPHSLWFHYDDTRSFNRGVLPVGNTYTWPDRTSPFVITLLCK